MKRCNLFLFLFSLAQLGPALGMELEPIEKVVDETFINFGMAGRVLKSFFTWNREVDLEASNSPVERAEEGRKILGELNKDATATIQAMRILYRDISTGLDENRRLLRESEDIAKKTRKKQKVILVGLLGTALVTCSTVIINIGGQVVIQAIFGAAD